MIGNRFPHPVDRHVGARLRLRRMTQGLTQNDVAETVGVSFQQLQKYERGRNRVSASRLHRLALALKAPTSWFFEDLPDAVDPSAEDRRSEMLLNFLTSAEGVELSRLFFRIPTSQRLQVLALARVLANDKTSSASED